MESFFLRAVVFKLLCVSALYASHEVHPVIVPQSSLMQTALPLSEEDEVLAIDRLITATKEQLALQVRLKELMVDFKKQKETFIQGEQTKQHAGRMVRTARSILEIISDQHLQYLFSVDYMQELSMFSSIAGKNGIKRP
jgi:hypothetical protein